MKLIKRDEAHRINNSETCQVVEYPFDEKDINGSVINVNGRYPESGFVMNEVCKEIIYIISGSGTLTVDDSTVDFDEGDSLYVDAGEKYFWQGNFTSYMACTPAFYPEQHKGLM
jgi:mannose-6-phosphate isomerase-like protein (cupin superfamily)